MPRTAPTASPLLDPHTLAGSRAWSCAPGESSKVTSPACTAAPTSGFSNEFAEHREYAPGDDLRYVDWKVFGKTDRFYLKQFEEETNLICYLLLDTSESMQYQGPGAPLSKLAYAQCAAAALAYLVLHQRDAVGLVTFDQEIRQLIRPSSSPTQLKQLLHVMEQTTAARKTRTGPIFHDLAERLARRGIVVILSDLFDDVDSMLAGLKHFRHRRHDVIVLHVLDPAEIDFPFQHVTMFKGLEALGEVVTEPRSLRAAYQHEVSVVSEASDDRLPRPANRLPHGPHRPTARHRADDVPLGPQEAASNSREQGAGLHAPGTMPLRGLAFPERWKRGVMCPHTILLAFGFGNLAMLGWLAAAAAPLLIHLWSRHRFREAPWAAMQFLLAAMRKNARRLQLQQWLLLAVRTLIIALVVLAVAEPYGEQLAASSAPTPAYRVLVIDGSLSMAYQDGNSSRFDRAKEFAAELVRNSRAGDKFSVILMSSPSRLVVGREIADPTVVAAQIESLSQQHTLANVAGALTLVEEALASASGEDNSIHRDEVYFFTDLQRATWRDAGSSRNPLKTGSRPMNLQLAQHRRRTTSGTRRTRSSNNRGPRQRWGVQSGNHSDCISGAVHHRRPRNCVRSHAPAVRLGTANLFECRATRRRRASRRANGQCAGRR